MRAVVFHHQGNIWQRLWMETKVMLNVTHELQDTATSAELLRCVCCVNHPRLLLPHRRRRPRQHILPAYFHVSPSLR